MNPSQDDYQAVESEQEAGFLGQQEMLLGGYYVWLVFVSTLDIMVTWIILHHEGGSEANPIAEAVLFKWGLPGMIAFKFALVTFFIVLCEVVARKKLDTGRWLAVVGVAISAFPSIYGMILLAKAGAFTFS
ncbi:DUF5658 family protein [Poriferisphaera sp. WC338]|uniref:DUF5658 family protein n=1 Tax=Poriferisphaera sp. WC338 TaxID=3425129 RepID=UPI003D81A525